jgi:hypothetical protein
MASPYRFQLWKKRMTGDNMGFVLIFRHCTGITGEMWGYFIAAQYNCCSAAKRRMHELNGNLRTFKAHPFSAL